MNAAQRAYIRQETGISIAINAVLSALFFFLVFGWHGPVAVSGFGRYAFDFLPQSFAIGFMATLVPGAITAARLRAGAVAPLATTTRLPLRLLPRAVAMGLVGMAIGLVPALAAMLVLGGEILPRLPALAAKVAYGGVLAVIVTPPGLRAALVGGGGSAR